VRALVEKMAPKKVEKMETVKRAIRKIESGPVDRSTRLVEAGDGKVRIVSPRPFPVANAGDPWADCPHCAERKAKNKAAVERHRAKKSAK